jgi:hypothetical protein
MSPLLPPVHGVRFRIELGSEWNPLSRRMTLMRLPLPELGIWYLVAG